MKQSKDVLLTLASSAGSKRPPDILAQGFFHFLNPQQTLTWSMMLDDLL